MPNLVLANETRELCCFKKVPTRHVSRRDEGGCGSILRSATVGDVRAGSNEPLRQHALGTRFARLATDTKILAPENPPRGVCCHEAGHAVVAFSLSVPVVAVRVSYSEVPGWHGGTDTLTDHLDYMDRVTILMAGRAAEEVFSCPAHETAWLHDLGQIAALLRANGVPEEAHPSLIIEGDERARAILERHRDKVHKLIDRLVECGRVERPEFLRLMNGETL